MATSTDTARLLESNREAILRIANAHGAVTVRVFGSAARGEAEPDSDLDWRGIVGFRNVLVHDYLGVDLDRVWQVVERDLPELEQQIALILQSEDG